MQLRLLLIACLACSTSGCATDGQDQTASAQAPARQEGTYRTGSRLPSYDPPGTAASREVSRDDWNDDRRTGGMQGKWQ